MTSKPPPPNWAYRSVTADEREAVAQAHEKGTLRTNWSAAKDLKSWAKQQNWPTPWLNFESKFYETMLANDENFALAVSQSGLKISIPKTKHTLSAAELEKFDGYYENPQNWRWLVEELREVRRAVEVGVVVRVEDKELKSFDSFYTWAHGRYHALEDGADEWIGTD